MDNDLLFLGFAPEEDVVTVDGPHVRACFRVSRAQRFVRKGGKWVWEGHLPLAEQKALDETHPVKEK